MEADEQPGNWNELKGKLKEKFEFLTDEDLRLDAGNRNEMFGNLRKKLGKSEEEMHQIILAL